MEGRRSFGQEAGLDAAQVQDEDRRNRPCPEMSFGPEATTGVRVLLQGRDRPCRWSSLDLGRKGRRGGPLGRRPQQGCRSSFLLEARGVGIGAGGTALEVAFSREALHLPWPSRRRPQRGCSSAHDKDFAGGAVCIELGSPCLSLPDRSASERALRAGVAVDGRCAAGWRWRSVEPAGGAEEPGPSLCLKGGSGRAFCLGRRMGVCWHSPSGRWPQGEGRSAVWCGGRWRVLPLGRMKRVILSRSGQAGCCRCGPGRHAGKPSAFRLQGGWRPALWLGGGRMRAGWGGASPSRAGLCAGGGTKQPLCVRWPSGCRASGWRLRAMTLCPGGCMQGVGVQPSVRM
jgi:hypothetical protein